MIILAVPIGILIGISLGALGGGGSILTVPALVYLLHQNPHAATTGSLLVVGISALAGMAAHRRAGRVEVAAGLVFGALGLAGSYAGTRLSARVDPHVLLTAFAALMIVAAAAMVRRRGGAGAPAPAGSGTGAGDAVGARRAGGHDTVAVKPAPTSRLAHMGRAGAVRLVVAATVVGLLTGFFGVGGGFVIVPALVLALSFPMPVAVGTSLLVIAVNSATALGARLGGHVQLDWPLLALSTVSAIAGSIAGNRIASRVHPELLKRGFVALLVLVAVYTATRSIPHLV